MDADEIEQLSLASQSELSGSGLPDAESDSEGDSGENEQ
jgi:hypothetical protein